MSTFFMALLVVYMIHAVVTNRHTEAAPPARIPRITLVLQAPLLAYAVYYGVRQGIFSRDLVSPVSIGLGLAAGHLIFGISLLVTHRVVRDAAQHFVDLGSLWRFLTENPALLLRFFSVSFTEELVYRVTAQPLLIAWTGSPWLAIGLVALGFSVIHHHFFRNPWGQSAEFICFAVLLGALYYWTGSLMLVVVIHALRNLESVYLEYLVKAEELGDEALAMDAIEKMYAQRPSEIL